MMTDCDGWQQLLLHQLTKSAASASAASVAAAAAAVLPLLNRSRF